MLGNVTLNEV